MANSRHSGRRFKVWQGDFHSEGTYSDPYYDSPPAILSLAELSDDDGILSGRLLRFGVDEEYEYLKGSYPLKFLRIS